MKRFLLLYILPLLFLSGLPPASADAPGAVVASVTGRVEYSMTGRAPWTAIRTNDRIPVGATVRSRAGGEATLRIGASEAKVKDVSRVIIESTDGRGGARFKLVNGSVVTQIPHGLLPASGPPAFTISTPVAVAGVRGTMFSAAYNAGGYGWEESMGIKTAEGAVAVYRPEDFAQMTATAPGAGGAPGDFDPGVLVPAGFALDVGPGWDPSNVQPRQMTQEEKNQLLTDLGVTPTEVTAFQVNGSQVSPPDAAVVMQEADLAGGEAVLTGRFGAPARTTLALSIDGGATWRDLTVGEDNTFRFAFAPEAGKSYAVRLRATNPGGIVVELPWRPTLSLADGAPALAAVLASLSVNGTPITAKQAAITMAEDQLTNAEAVVEGTFTGDDGLTRRISLDRGANWQDLPAGNPFRFTFAPAAGTTYHLRFKAADAAGSEAEMDRQVSLLLPAAGVVVPSLRELRILGEFVTIGFGGEVALNDDDLAATAGEIVIEGTADGSTDAGPLKVDVSTDNGSTWTEAVGAAPFRFAFTPQRGSRYPLAIKITDAAGTSWQTDPYSLPTLIMSDASVEQEIQTFLNQFFVDLGAENQTGLIAAFSPTFQGSVTLTDIETAFRDFFACASDVVVSPPPLSISASGEGLYIVSATVTVRYSLSDGTQPTQSLSFAPVVSRDENGAWKITSGSVEAFTTGLPCSTATSGVSLSLSGITGWPTDFAISGPYQDFAPLSVTLTGAGFSPGMQVHLVEADGTLEALDGSIDPDMVGTLTVISSTEARFDFSKFLLQWSIGMDNSGANPEVEEGAIRIVDPATGLFSNDLPMTTRIFAGALTPDKVSPPQVGRFDPSYYLTATGYNFVPPLSVLITRPNLTTQAAGFGVPAVAGPHPTGADADPNQIDLSGSLSLPALGFYDVFVTDGRGQKARIPFEVIPGMTAFISNVTATPANVTLGPGNDFFPQSVSLSIFGGGFAPGMVVEVSDKGPGGPWRPANSAGPFAGYWNGTGTGSYVSANQYDIFFDASSRVRYFDDGDPNGVAPIPTHVRIFEPASGQFTNPYQVPVTVGVSGSGAPTNLSGLGPTTVGRGAGSVPFSLNGFNIVTGAQVFADVSPGTPDPDITMSVSNVEPDPFGPGDPNQPERIVGTMNVGPCASPGAHDIRVVNPVGGSPTAVLSGAMTVAPGPPPSIFSVTPTPASHTIPDVSFSDIAPVAVAITGSNICSGMGVEISDGGAFGPWRSVGGVASYTGGWKTASPGDVVFTPPGQINVNFTAAARVRYFDDGDADGTAYYPNHYMRINDPVSASFSNIFQIPFPVTVSTTTPTGLGTLSPVSILEGSSSIGFSLDAFNVYTGVQVFADRPSSPGMPDPAVPISVGSVDPSPFGKDPSQPERIVGAISAGACPEFGLHNVRVVNPSGLSAVLPNALDVQAAQPTISNISFPATLDLAGDPDWGNFAPVVGTINVNGNYFQPTARLEWNMGGPWMDINAATPPGFSAGGGASRFDCINFKAPMATADFKFEDGGAGVDNRTVNFRIVNQTGGTPISTAFPVSFQVLPGLLSQASPPSPSFLSRGGVGAQPATVNVWNFKVGGGATTVQLVDGGGIPDPGTTVSVTGYNPQANQAAVAPILSLDVFLNGGGPTGAYFLRFTNASPPSTLDIPITVNP